MRLFVAVIDNPWPKKASATCKRNFMVSHEFPRPSVSSHYFPMACKRDQKEIMGELFSPWNLSLNKSLSLSINNLDSKREGETISKKDLSRVIVNHRTVKSRRKNGSSPIYSASTGHCMKEYQRLLQLLPAKSWKVNLPHTTHPSLPLEEVEWGLK